MSNKNLLLQAFLTVFKNPIFVVLSLSLTLNLLALYYFLLYKITTFEVFWASNMAWYNWLSVISTVLISFLFGVAISFLFWQWQEKKENIVSHGSNSLIASFLGAISTGCPVCGALLASAIGIGGGLAAFPFQGLEVKFISLGLLGFAVFSSAKSITTKTCQKTSLKPLFAGVLLLVFVIYLPIIADKLNFRVSFQPEQGASLTKAVLPTSDAKDLINQINPPKGFIINAVYGDIGPKLLEAGAIDLGKMKSLYEKAGQPLTESQIKILTKGSDEKIKITPENSYFLLNFLWVFGITNKNPILEEGPIAQYGQNQIGRFASTGGWTLGIKPATEFFSKYPIVTLSEKQQDILEEFAFNSYRPCCSNPTGFPDCNHGATALGLGEIMASQGASADEIFEAFKYFNAFWFPQTYFDIAKYFQVKEGKSWSEISGRLVAGKDYSTPQGWQRVRQWLSKNNLIKEASFRGSGCGV